MKRGRQRRAVFRVCRRAGNGRLPKSAVVGWFDSLWHSKWWALLTFSVYFLHKVERRTYDTHVLHIFQTPSELYFVARPRRLVQSHDNQLRPPLFMAYSKSGQVLGSYCRQPETFHLPRVYGWQPLKGLWWMKSDKVSRWELFLCLLLLERRQPVSAM